jgi:beta-glucosidase
MATTTEKPPYLDSARPLEARAADLASRLTLEEKVALMAGAEAFTLEGVGRLGVPRINVTDGPTGVRSNEGEPATVFPVGVALASTWNVELAREVGAAIGREALALGSRVVLAPTINIMRTPLWGRNFETYSEDPFLAGRLGAAYVEGLQGEGVGASLKHYAANNQEVGRMTVSVEADERTLREVYLSAFEYVVKQADPWTVMASYNRIDGVYATENRKLLIDILKEEWGYDGVVVSDWGAVHATAAAANGGTDLEMPGPPRWFGAKLLAAVAAGEVPTAQIDDAALRMCRLIIRTGVLDDGPPPKGELRTARHRSIAEAAALEAVVLLKNDGDLLPFEPAGLKRVAVVGPNAAARRIQGGGSSQVRTDKRVSLLSALTDRLAGRAEVLHADGGDNEPFPPAARPAMFSPDQARGQAGILCEYFATGDFAGARVAARQERALGKLVSHDLGGGQPAGYGAFRWSGWFWPDRDGRHEFSIRGPGELRMWLDGAPLIDDGVEAAYDQLDVGGRFVPRKSASAELASGRGYPIRVEYTRAYSTRAEQAGSEDSADGLAWEYVSLGVRAPRGTVAEAAALAASCDAAVVVVGSASISEGEGYDRTDLDLPGDQNALVEAVLAANPRTVVVLTNGAPYVLPWIEHTPALIEAWMGGEAGPDAVARIILGEAAPSGKLPITFPQRLEDSPAQPFYPGGETVAYGEGLHIGYRHFDAGNEPPMFPFGFGLTYTKFKYANLTAPEVVRVGDPVAVTFTLKNVGERPGKETVQLYVRPRGPSVDRPVKELKGFAKVALAPLEEKFVRIDLDARSFAFYDPASGRWVAEPGAYDLLIGGSAADIELQATVRLEATY